MFGSDILEVAIGLVFVYLIVSLLCSTLSEWIARIFAMRAKTLEAGIGRFLGGDEELRKKVYDHPLIKGLSRKGRWDRRLDRLPHDESNGKLLERVRVLNKVPLLNKIPSPRSSPGPSNIPANKFALTLFDTLMTAGREVRGEEAESAATAIASVTGLDDEGKSRALQLRAEEVFKNLEKGIEEHVKSSEAKSLLRTILTSATAQVDRWDKALGAFRVSLEKEFDGAMDRVSGWYKRQAQLIILGLAIVICLTLNVDTFVIGKTLFQDTTLREAAVAVAEARAQQPLPDDAVPEDIGTLREELTGLALPIGWSSEEGQPTSVPIGFGGWVVKLAGVLFTAFAVALGAPFWFDLLNRLVNLRASGKQPAKAADVEPDRPTTPAAATSG